jgi:hypothetical protein
MSFGPLSYLGTPNATTETKGKVEFATIAETTAGVRTDLACTPAGVAAVAIAGAPDASTTQKGIIEIATNAEAIDSGNTDLALVPSNMPSIFASPDAIGGTVPAGGAFTTLSASGAFSLTGDQVTVPEGGTGVASLTDHGIVLGSGAAAVSVTAVGSTGQILIGQSAADPIWSDNIDVPGTLDVTGVATFDDAVSMASTLDVSGDATFDTNTLFVDVSQNNVGVGTATPAAADKLHVTLSTAGTTMIAEFEHSDNVNAASHSEVLVQTGGASGGDPKLVLDVSAVTQYYIGVDNSDSDILKIGAGTAVGTTSSVQLTSAGALSVLRGDFDVTRSGGAATPVQGTVSNTDNTNADSNASMIISSGGASGGDPKVVLTVSGAQSYHIGVDNSASDVLMIGSGTAVGTTDSVSLNNAGAVGVLRGDVTITRDAGAGSSLGLNITNTNAADATSNALLAITSGNAASGDPQVNLIVTGGSTHHIGVDNSDSDKLKIGLGASVGTTDNMSIATTGAVQILRGDLATVRSSAAAEVLCDVTNSDNTSTDSDAFFEAAVGGTSSGNPGIRFQISGGQAYAMGIDNASGSDDLLICGDNDIGTDPLVTIAEAGAVTINKGALTVTTGGATLTSGNLTLTSGNINVTSGNMTLSSGSLTLTSGDETLTAGNVIINGAAKQLRVHGGAATDFIGQVTLTAGTVTVLNTNIAATDRIFLSRASLNSSTALGQLTVTAQTASTSFVITAVSAADGATTITGDTSKVNYFIVRQV